MKLTKEQFEALQTKTLENGQVLVEIEPNTWVDYETYKPNSSAEVVNNGE
jgi:hypothetical protein